MTHSPARLDAPPLLEIRDLAVDYPNGRKQPRRAVDGVSLTIHEGETLGLVGESGSGKSTIGRAVLGLAPVTEGSIRFDGHELGKLGRKERRQFSSSLQVVFQDPYSSLDPTKTIAYSLAEPLISHGSDRAEARREASAMLERVGLRPEDGARYPAGFSGGQRQRIAIARALMLRPRLVICDEPVSALDLSIQAQVLNLMTDLQKEFRLSYLFIAHDLTVVRHVSDRVAVLNEGRIVEEGTSREVYENPQHPYTRALLAAAPVPDPAQQRHRREARQADRTRPAEHSPTGPADDAGPLPEPVPLGKAAHRS
ncbi:ATP-binding cassette domain-containing protein [Sinomonas sp. ASV486]|uniref:ATP-binding cassette domain-containing protein n=1 Tax=Sinomonas sp. ASV486 TaxID=3051170 RepID=UPI0027DCB3B4|nr:ATP-binding cassette domain-containing protein [Sinomonas sp. ASV486]MDQ4488978.1 ATP-binding cassette domain-containing protein [Sinomonas sp. ASV486]